MFVEEEGSWWWTSNSDENGSSGWAARAQERLLDPLPEDVTYGTAADEFHLLSDEELIPPYYRTRPGTCDRILVLFLRGCCDGLECECWNVDGPLVGPLPTIGSFKPSRLLLANGCIVHLLMILQY